MHVLMLCRHNASTQHPMQLHVCIEHLWCTHKISVGNKKIDADAQSCMHGEISG